MYILEASPWLQIFPAGAISGLVLQLFAIWLKKKTWLIGGLLLTVSCALYERDIILVAGNILACVGIWLCLFSDSRKS